MRVTHIAGGHIVAVQEERFRLITDTGQGLVLALAHGASLGISDLSRLELDDAHVIVRYTGLPNLETGTAHSIRPTAAVP